MAETAPEQVKAALKFFSDPCNVFSKISSIPAGEHRIKVGKRELTIRVVRDRFCRAAVDLMRYTGRLIRDDFRCLVYQRSRTLMACSYLKNAAIIGVKEGGAVTFYVLE